PLLDYAGIRGLPTQAVAGLRDEGGVYDVLSSLATAQVVGRYEAGTERVFQIRPGRHGVAAFYRNSAIHWFVNRAILETVMLAVVDDEGSDSLETGWQAAFALRDLLKFEFFFSDKAAFEAEMREEARILADDDFRGRVATAQGRRVLLAEAPFRVAHRVLPQFLEAYWLLAERLAAWPTGEPVVRAALLEQCVKVGHQYVLQQRLHNPESVSRELCGNAWMLADNRGLLSEDGAGGRAAFAAELARAVAAVAAIATLDASTNPEARR
ncbi:MAG: hypothetical protein L0H19_08790, partial [Salinisphaera sp.]|nr:hypothetical protein [Salinisphaera sp.]